MKKPILLLLLCTFLWSCMYDIVDNTRFEFYGTVVDPSGLPIPSQYIYLDGIDTWSEGESQKKLGVTYTNTSGEFQLVSLQSIYNVLHINRPDSLDYNIYWGDYDIDPNIRNWPIDSVYTSVDYFGVSESKNLGEIELRKRSFLTIKLKHTSATTADTLRWSLSYTHAICVYYYKNGKILQRKSKSFETYADNPIMKQTPKHPHFEHTYNSIIDGTALFTYQINNQPEHTVEIILDQRRKIYVLNY